MIRKPIRITPTGLEEAPSARADWNTWKFCLSLTPNEIQSYFTSIKNKLKYETDMILINDLRRKLTIANDIYTIKSRNPMMNEEYYSRLIYSTKEKGTELFTSLGFNNTDIYYEELNSICDMLSNNTILLDKCKIYDEDIYSTVLVSIIFDYYRTQYSEDELISVFDISLKEYLNLKIILSKWLIGNYWK